MARQFVGSRGGARPVRKRAGFRGTPRYASVEALRMNEQGRRDDLYSWFFMVVEFTTGALPWPEQRYQRQQQILLGSSPEEYKAILKHIQSLDLIEEPNYNFLFQCLMGCARRNRLPD
ncbi:unnamed protein product, partial [Soboliphyme baturini]|uniref:Protein kinase domain-containing protein n=1 Tax=Soboliphyme baturini TaxID=241478 RepID=A0A183JAT0_9BILA